MAKNDATLTAIPSGKAYLVAWIAAQVTLNLPWLAPWLTNQIKAAQSVDATLAAPDASKAIYAGVALLLSTLICFIHKVWKELEADAVKGTANLIKASPGMATELLVRCWDACWGFCTRWFVLWGFKRRYLKELCYRYGLFNDKGLGLINANRLDLDKVYVELQAAPEVNLNKPNFNPVTREIGHRAPLWEHLRTLRPGFALAMIGAPGSGKTTLLHHALLTFARNRQWRRRMRFRLPIFIELRKIAAELPADSKKNPTLPKLIESLWKKDSRFTELIKRLPKGWVEKWLRSGRCLLLWDGLDEVAEPDHRRRVRDWLEAMVLGSAEYRNNLSMVTARPAGYRDAPLEHAQAVEVQAFQWSDTKRFVQQWYHATEVVSSGNIDNAEVRRRATDESHELLTRLQDSSKLGDLAVNPLLLTMICMVHRFHGALPGSRSQLYDEICQVLLERWRQQRGMKDEHTSQQKLEVLRPLAVWMMEHRVKEINEDDMLPCIVEPLARIGVAPGKEAALAFIHELRDTSGLWLDKELKTWAFAHLTFQEHLCADAWVKKPIFRPKGSWHPYLSDAWWRETLLLYAAKTEDATQLAVDAMEGHAHCRVFALQLLDEKINLTASVRERMEQSLLASLESKDKFTFLAAAEAWFARQQERNFHRLDDQRQISGWVTAAEYQAFIFSAFGREELWRAPLHWNVEWFQDRYAAPILGMSALQAEEYCDWLNEAYPAWHHRLPTEKEVQNVAMPTQGIVAWLKERVGTYTLQNADPSWAPLLRTRIRAVAEIQQKSTRSVFTLPDLNISRAFARAHKSLLTWSDTLEVHEFFGNTPPFGPSLVHERLLVIDRILDYALDHALDRPIEGARDHARDRALAFSLALDRGLARADSRTKARFLELDRALNSIPKMKVDITVKQRLEFVIKNESVFERAIERITASSLELARERTVERATDLAKCLSIAEKSSLEFRQLEDWFHHLEAGGIDTESQKLQTTLLRALLPLARSPFVPSMDLASSRTIAVVAFELLRRVSSQKTSSQLPYESALHEHIDRACGQAEPFEGLRIVRERRM